MQRTQKSNADQRNYYETTKKFRHKSFAPGRCQLNDTQGGRAFTMQCLKLMQDTLRLAQLLVFVLND
ncbi:hypothetical protein C7W93_09560 [Glaciimonas sp. PCH181]|nr:hypothetical protein C7W93_09560 [Glaciimonas sp. PCH181]